MDIEQLKSAITDVMRIIPYRLFMCLPMSAALYAILTDNYKVNAKLATGNLKYNEAFIFKQDFSITEAKDSVFKEWSGHAWVEIDELICDLSFFRTLYSAVFTKPYKQELINIFGEGRGSIIARRECTEPLIYQTIEYLSNDLATGIIKGSDFLLKQ